MTNENPNGTAKKKAKYNDPLHFSYDDLTIEAGGRKMILNKRFLDQQNCWGNFKLIKKLFTKKFEIFEKMDASDCPVVLRTFDKELAELEFEIQEAFLFERNANFHRFWERPKCGCPKLDNQERFGSKYYIISGNCILHGGSSEEDN